MFHVTDFAPRAAVLDKENASTFVLPNLKGVFLVVFFLQFFVSGIAQILIVTPIVVICKDTDYLRQNTSTSDD